MKLIHLPILSLVLATGSYAADLSPTKLAPLAHPSQQMLQGSLRSGEYSLGLDIEQSKGFLVDPEASEVQPIQVTKRDLNLAVGLPGQSEFGFTIQDIHEHFVPPTESELEAADHASRPLGAQLWLRLNLVDMTWFKAAATAQYQPGMSTSASFLQASQDRSSLGLDLTVKPLPLFTSTVYAQYSRRHDERLANRLLGQEQGFGARFAVGSQTLGIYGDMNGRYLSSTDLEHASAKKLFAKEMTAGIYLGSHDLQASAFAIVPDKNRYAGVAERGLLRE